MGCGREESVVFGNALQSLKAAEAGLFLHPYGSYFPRERSAFMVPWMLSPMSGSSPRDPLLGSLDETHGFKDKDEK